MKKRILSLLLCAALLLSVSGCADLQTEEKPHFGFSNGVLLEEDKEVYMEADALPYSEVIWDEYRSSFHYNKLTDTEKRIYQALEYAMEKGYTNILVDIKLAESGEAIKKVLDAFAQDSPMLEQNLRCTIGTFTAYYPTKLLGFLETQTLFVGNYITVQNFAAEQLEKKQLALNEAKKIVSGLSETTTQKEKAEELFAWLCQNTVYETYPESSPDMVYPYLYDGLVTGKTQCDGFANSLSLLLNLAGVECVEKAYIAEEETEIGHTWNFFQLDGAWYNADATGGEGKKTERQQYFFGYPDVLQEYVPANAGDYPVSDKGLNFQVDAVLADYVNLKQTLIDAYKSHDKHYALIVVNEITEKQIRSAAQELANAIDGEVHYMHMNLTEGRTALWFFDLQYFT